LLGGLAGASHAAAVPSLSAADERALRAGQVIFKPEVPPGRHGPSGMGGTALVYLRSDARKVWNILVDFPHHPDFFPRVKETHVVEESPDRTLVSYLVAVGPFSFRFFLNNYADTDARVLRWELDRTRDSGIFRDHWGYWKVEPWGTGVLVTYAMGGEIKLPTFMARGAGQEGAVQTVKALKARVEKS
jgi:ribosome-associated toxin RatA of RatAB toxin-antitoxin module